VKVEFVETPWDSMFAALEADRFDIVANQVTINPERQGKYDLSQPYTVGEGVIVTRANDDSIKSLADIKGKTAAENATSNWSEVARKAGARVESVEGFSQAITLLNQGRVDVVINDSIAVYAYLAETGDKSVKIAGTVGEKSEQAFAARKNSGTLPELDKALGELRADGTLAAISQKYLKADATGPRCEGRVRGNPMGFHLRRARGQPLRHRRQRGHHHPGTPGEVRLVRAVLRW
jgi:ABC-type amino acid transport substrate-binding protein